MQWRVFAAPGRNPLREVIDCSVWSDERAPLPRWGGRSFDPAVEFVEEPVRPASQRPPTRDRVIFALRGAPARGLTTEQIAARAATSIHNASTALGRLAELRLVVRVGAVGRAVLWRLA